LWKSIKKVFTNSSNHDPHISEYIDIMLRDRYIPHTELLNLKKFYELCNY